MIPSRIARRIARRILPALAASVLVLACTGCIRRMATITSEPCGAKITMNGVFRGATPVEVPYEWNWFYDIKVEAPGFQTQTVRERFYAPPQHWIPFDLVTELLPLKSRESQWRHYRLSPTPEL